MKEYHILKQKDLMLIISRNSTCQDVNHRIFIGHPSLRPIREAMKKFLEAKKMKNFEVPLLETEIKTNLSQEINEKPRTFDSKPKNQGKNELTKKYNEGMVLVQDYEETNNNELQNCNKTD